MKLSKKAVTLISFSLGTVLFVTTAFADTALGSGYDKLKGAVKTTAEQLNKKEKNFAADYLLTITDNGKNLVQVSFAAKFDNEKDATENKTTIKMADGTDSNSYSYQDPTVHIWANEKEADKYFVSEMSAKDRPGEQLLFPNPFKENGAPEIEKIFDLVIGNLKSEVQFSEKEDGSNQFAGSLSETQVPALINAISSFGIKQMIPRSGMERNVDNSVNIPMIESDIYIKKVTGKANQNKLGIMESLQGEVILVGKEKNGTVHELALTVVAKITDFGKTVVTKPDLTGKTVENVAAFGKFGTEYIGKYKSEIIVKKNGKFEKVGERIVVIAHVDDKTVEGKYYETIKAGFEEYGSKYEFTFAFNQGDPSNTFTFKNPQGQEEQGNINEGPIGRLYIDLNSGKYSIDSGANSNNVFTDSMFLKVFDE